MINLQETITLTEAITGMGVCFWYNDFGIASCPSGWTSVNYDWSMVVKATINQSKALRLAHQTIPEIVAPKACAHSPYSLWSRKLVSLALIHFIAIYPADSAIQLLNYRKSSINPPPLKCV